MVATKNSVITIAKFATLAIIDFPVVACFGPAMNVHKLAMLFLLSPAFACGGSGQGDNSSSDASSNTDSGASENDGAVSIDASIDRDKFEIRCNNHCDITFEKGV